MRRGSAAIIVPLVVVALASCAREEGSPGSVRFGSQTPGAASKPATESEVLAFEAPMLGGGQIDGGDLEGKDVAIWFWAPW